MECITMGYYVKGQLYLLHCLERAVIKGIKKLVKKSRKRKKVVKYHKNGLPIETRYKEEDYKYYK